MSRVVIIIGAGGHAAVIADALLARGLQVLGFTDANRSRHARKLCGLPVLGDDSILDRYSRTDVLLANGVGGVGHSAPDPVRGTMQKRLMEQGWRFTAVLHPGSIVSPFAHLDAGVQILAGSLIQTGARIGEGCIVNTGAIVEHDVVLGDYTHVAPGAVVCGDVSIGAGSHIGAGAVVRQGINLGEGTVVGVGAVVINDTGGNCVLVGVPAKPMEQRR